MAGFVHEPGRLRIVGEVDLSNADALAQAAHVACGALRGGDELVLDCSAWAYVDLTGLRALSGATAAFRRAGGKIRLEDASGAVLRVLEFWSGRRLDDRPDVWSSA